MGATDSLGRAVKELFESEAYQNRFVEEVIMDLLPKMDGKGDECIGCGQVLADQVIFRADGGLKHAKKVKLRFSKSYVVSKLRATADAMERLEGTEVIELDGPYVTVVFSSSEAEN